MSDTNVQYFGNRVEDRRLFTQEERQHILHRTGCICATCGKRLTLKSMTVEHIIPISRGGTNDMKNLLPLCYDCNQYKGNLFYIGPDYYTAIRSNQLLDELWSICKDWFVLNKDKFNTQKYPLISPCITLELNTGTCSKTFLLSHLLDIHYVTHSDYSTIEAVSGLTLSSESSYYIVKRRTTDKLLLLMRVEYIDSVVRIFVEWWDMESKKVLSKILWDILLTTMWRHNEFGLLVQGGCIRCNNIDLIKFLWSDCYIAGREGYTTQKWEFPESDFKYCAIASKSLRQILKIHCMS